MRIPVQYRRRHESVADRSGSPDSGEATLVGIFNGADGGPCAVLTHPGNDIFTLSLASHILTSMEVSPLGISSGEIPSNISMEDWIAVQELLFISNALNNSGGIRERAAARVSVSIATLYRKLAAGKKACIRLGIEPPSLSKGLEKE
jgi:hypothetical protein